MENKIIEKEKSFHDQWALSINPNEVFVKETFEACTSPENKKIMEWLGDIKGKRILELGCGAGEASIYFALKGARVEATDISGEMINVLNTNANKYQVKIGYRICSAFKTGFPDNTFDIVYAANLLHHVDIGKTLREAHRVLKIGGAFVSWDPLAHNPAINYYRRIATEVRTEDEKPLWMKDLIIFKNIFGSVKYETTWLCTLWIFVKFYFIERIDPNKERYWKRIIKEHRKLEKTYNFLAAIDKMMMKLFPFMKRFCWNIVIWAQK